MKLIKLSDTHYIVVDDSEISKGDFYLEGNSIQEDFGEHYLAKQINEKSNCKIITHSTQPLEYRYDSQKQGFNMGAMSSDIELVFYEIKQLSLSEVEEAIYGYSVEKLAEQETIKNEFNREISFIRGFKAHQELSKDRFTMDDIRKSFRKCFENKGLGYSVTMGDLEVELCKAQSSKTEWEVEFDQNGKLKLLNELKNPISEATKS